MKTGILLINLGTPDSPSTKDVRKYLREFLMDPFVIDVNPIVRWILINLIIAPIRGPKSAKLYKAIWKKEGSPLLTNGQALKAKLQLELGKDFLVTLGMRYQSPSIQSALKELQLAEVTKIIAIPLYPQYAAASNASSIESLKKEVALLGLKQELEIVPHFYQREEYLNALVASANGIAINNYDHVLFSFHGIPERHIRNNDKKMGDGKCEFGSCCETSRTGNHFCYRANCVQTANEIAKRLGLNKENFSIAFQSRLGKDPWIKPYSDFEIIRLAKEGKKNILAFSPAFVADCLETIYEIGTEYNELFQENGGESIKLVPSLNANSEWVAGLKKIILS